MSPPELNLSAQASTSNKSTPEAKPPHDAEVSRPGDAENVGVLREAHDRALAHTSEKSSLQEMGSIFEKEVQGQGSGHDIDGQCTTVKAVKEPSAQPPRGVKRIAPADDATHQSSGPPPVKRARSMRQAKAIGHRRGLAVTVLPRLTRSSSRKSRG
ncbi:hypothetical protein HGRIS_006196 [Hohenbuehelia grisea]|uniref:Uncharacterized protein n=1 Tax=Hohenbuehelia grisea TaxID=104357 RepID=A0ABR3K0S4_9AGAR